MQNQDQQFLEYVIKALVDNPNDVKVARTVDEMGVLMTLEVNAADMGQSHRPRRQYGQGRPHALARRRHEEQFPRQLEDQRARRRAAPRA